MEVNRIELEDRAFGESLAELEIGGTTISLPQPMITNTDRNYADKITQAYLSNSITFPHGIQENRWVWGKNSIDEAMHSKEKRDSLLSWLGEQKEKSQAKAFVFTPLFNNDVILSKSVIRFFRRIQIEAEVSFVNEIDNPAFTPQQTKEMLTEAAKEIEDRASGKTKELLLFIKASSNERIFEQKQQTALEIARGTTVLYADPRKYFGNFITLASLHNKDYLRILSNVPKSHPKHSKPAVLPNSLLIADTFSLERGRGGSNKNDEKKRKHNARTNVRRFTEGVCGYLRPADHKKEYGDVLNCPCPIEEGKDLDDVLIEYREELFPAFAIHNASSIYQTVADTRQVMESGESAISHLKTKKYAQTVLTDLFQVGQKQLG